MSEHAINPASGAALGVSAEVHHEDPMSHVPPPSLWPFLVMLGLIPLPFGVLSVLGALDGSPVGPLKDPRIGTAMIVGSSVFFFFCLMGWANQVIKEKRIAHDVVQQQKDLQMFILLFLCGEATAFSAIFGYFFYRNFHDATFGPLPGMHFGGPLAAYATFFLLSSSLTCEVAHHAINDGKRLLGKIFLIITLALGGIFLGMTGYEWGELLERGFKPILIPETGAAAFASTFFTGTGFHAVHVATGLVLLFMVLMRLESGHFQGKRNFSMAAASWYWHFVDIVWVLLFITVYVVA
jgi:cytochrome c oxidase subunit 3